MPYSETGLEIFKRKAGQDWVILGYGKYFINLWSHKAARVFENQFTRDVKIREV